MEYVLLVERVWFTDRYFSLVDRREGDRLRNVLEIPRPHMAAGSCAFGCERGCSQSS